MYVRGTEFLSTRNQLKLAPLSFLSLVLFLTLGLPLSNRASAQQPNDPATAAANEDPPEVKIPVPFEGWEDPRLVLLFTGNQYGYVEPCGCTGLENQKGGLARRATLLDELRTKRHWEVAPLDVGNQLRGFGPQTELKFQFSSTAMKEMKYEAIGFGPDDLRLGGGSLLSEVAIQNGFTPYVSANVGVFDWADHPKYQIVEAAGLRIAVTHVLGSEHVKALGGGKLEDITVLDPKKALKDVADQIALVGKTKRIDLGILLAYAPLNETMDLLDAHSKVFSVAVSASSIGEPGPVPLRSKTNKLVLETGQKGMFATAIGIFGGKGEKPTVKYTRIPLDNSFSDSPKMLKLMAGYQNALQQQGLSKLVSEFPHPSGGKFVGSDRCGECHTKAFAIWSNSGHAHATDSIVHPRERAEIPRHFDPECLSCHVTGWDPQGYHPFKTGYRSLKETKHLTQNGCENCHGPGGKHVAVENGEMEAVGTMRDDLRAAMRLPLSKAKDKCLECHDLDNSPNFHDKDGFERYWKDIIHVGKD